MMVVAAQAGLISLNCFLPGSDGPLAAQTFPEEALIMRKMSGEVTCRSLLKDLGIPFHLCWSWAHRKICFKGLDGKFSSEGVAVGLRTAGVLRLRNGDGVSATTLASPAASGCGPQVCVALHLACLILLGLLPWPRTAVALPLVPW